MTITTELGPVARLLTQHRAILSDPARWTSGATARRADGTPCSGQDPEAYCFCALASLGIAHRQLWPGGDAPHEAFVVAYELLTEHAGRLYGRTLVRVNEDLGHAAVLDVVEASLADVPPAPIRHRRALPRLLFSAVAPWLRRSLDRCSRGAA